MPVMKDTPFPPSGGFVQAIRDSCHALRKASYISIERSSIERFLTSPAFKNSFQRVSQSHGLAFPLKFPSVVAELNLLSVLSLLNFASGYRVPLHEQTGRGAWDNIRALVFSLYLTSSTHVDLLSARGMSTIREQNVAELMQVELHVERPHEDIPGVVIGELGGPVHQLVKLITHTLNETGEILINTGYPDLGSFVLEALKYGEKAGAAKGAGPDIDVILERIVRAIPGFRDMAVVNDQPVYVFKKALFLIHAVAVRFGSNDAPLVPIPDTSSLPVFSDNVLPSLLIQLGVIDITPALETFPGAFLNATENLDDLLADAVLESSVVAKMPKPVPVDGPVLNLEQAYILRAAAVDACEMIVEVARSSELPIGGTNDDKQQWLKYITLPSLDMWLWAVAKDRTDYRRLERLVLRDTIMF